MEIEGGDFRIVRQLKGIPLRVKKSCCESWGRKAAFVSPTPRGGGGGGSVGDLPSILLLRAIPFPYLVIKADEVGCCVCVCVRARARDLNQISLASV